MAFSTERAPRRLAVRGTMKIPGMVASMEASELCGSLAPIHERPTKAPLECVLVDLCAIEEVRLDLGRGAAAATLRSLETSAESSTAFSLSIMTTHRRSAGLSTGIYTGNCRVSQSVDLLPNTGIRSFRFGEWECRAGSSTMTAVSSYLDMNMDYLDSESAEGRA